MKYRCLDCNHLFDSIVHFDVKCDACNSENTELLGDDFKESDGSFSVFTKKPNRYVFIGIILLVISFFAFKMIKTTNYKTVYTFGAEKFDEYIQFYIDEEKVNDKGHVIGEKIRLTGDKVNKFGIYLMIKGKALQLNELKDGDKFYPCFIPVDEFTFMVDPKRKLKAENKEIKKGTKIINWLPTRVSKINCIALPMALTEVKIKSEGVNIRIETNLDKIPKKKTIYYSITGPKGPFVESKNIWNICNLSEVNVCAFQEGGDTIYADFQPFVVDRSSCPCSSEENNQLRNSIISAGNALGKDVLNTQLLQNFENSFGRVGTGLLGVKFDVPGRTNISYMQFQSYIMSFEQDNAPKLSCSVLLSDCKVQKVVFKLIM